MASSQQRALGDLVVDGQREHQPGTGPTDLLTEDELESELLKRLGVA